MSPEEEEAERRVVLETIRGALVDRSMREWRILHYGRQVVTDWGDVYEIGDDGSLELLSRAVSQ